MVGIVAAVDERNGGVLAEQLHGLILDETRHDDIHIAGNILDLGNDLAEREIGILPQLVVICTAQLGDAGCKGQECSGGGLLEQGVKLLALERPAVLFRASAAVR